MNLSENDITEEAAHAFCLGLVGGADEDPKDKRMRVACTTGNPVIKHINLSKNDINTNSVKCIEIMLRKGGLKNLRSFDLSDNLVKPDIQQAINKHMHRNELEAQKPKMQVRPLEHQ